MNVTTKSINQDLDRLLVLQKKTKNQLQKKQNLQLEDERALTQSGSACRKSTLDKISFNLNNMDERKLKTEIDQRFFSSSTMIAAMCVTDSVFYVPGNSLGTLLKLKKWIHNLKRIGAESAFGVALRGDLGPAEGMFILKAPQSGRASNEELIHELVVGMYGTNKLRGTIPNFSYVYGGFSCAPPIVDDNKNVVSWCTGNNPVTYAIYENIQPAISWKEYVKTASGEQFLSGYLQVLYALAEAVKKIDFTHYDLHWENVLMRDYPRAPNGYFQIKYNTENGEEYLVTNKVATIIDYGNAHIAYNGKHYGNHRFLSIGIYPDRSHPFHDAYKLLMFSILAAWEVDNQSVLNEAFKIYKFFNQTTDPYNAVEDQFDPSRYAIPISSTKGKTLFDLTTFIRNLCDCSFVATEPGNVAILACVEACPTVQSIFTEVGLSMKSNYTATSLFDFYEIYKATGRKVDMNYEALKENFIGQLTDQYDEIFRDLQSVKVIDLTGNNYIDETSGYIYMDFLYQLVNLLDRYNTYLLELYIGQEVIDMFERGADFSEFNSLDGQFNKLVSVVEGNEKMFQGDKNVFKDNKLNKHFDVAERIFEIHDAIMRK